MFGLIAASDAAPTEDLWSIEETTADLDRAWQSGPDAYAERALKAFETAHLTVEVLHGQPGIDLRCGVVADGDISERARRLSLLAGRDLSVTQRRAAIIALLLARRP
jgi:hypothetical protein